MELETFVEALVESDAATAFECASNTEDLPKIFPGKGPVPGVVSASVVGGGPLVAGAVRRVHTRDGNVLDETYLRFDRPDAYAYEMTKLTVPLSLLFTRATGSWTFTPEGGATRVHWSYRVALTSPLAAPLAAVLVKVFIRGAMAECLRRVKANAEARRA